MYPEPFIDRVEFARTQQEIRSGGFVADDLLAALDRPTAGLNVAFSWPLPAAFRPAYEGLRDALLALDGGVFVYPFQQTHVTVATLVNFKRHAVPDAATQASVAALIPALSQRLTRITEDLSPFPVEIGPPVLVRPAAFLPIRDPTGTVALARERLVAAVADLALAEMAVPRAVHSTVLRFRRAPEDAGAFAARFMEIAERTRFGTATIDELLLTTETRPYMAGGEIVARARLGGNR